MATTGIINTQALTDEIGVLLKAAIIEAAEPHIKDALDKIETKMRQRVRLCGTDSYLKMMEFQVNFRDMVS